MILSMCNLAGGIRSGTASNKAGVGAQEDRNRRERAGKWRRQHPTHPPPPPPPPHPPQQPPPPLDGVRQGRPKRVARARSSSPRWTFGVHRAVARVDMGCRRARSSRLACVPIDHRRGATIHLRAAFTITECGSPPRARRPGPHRSQRERHHRNLGKLSVHQSHRKPSASAMACSSGSSPSPAAQCRQPGGQPRGGQPQVEQASAPPPAACS